VKKNKVKNKIKHKSIEQAVKPVKEWANRLKNIPCFIVGNGTSLDKELPEDKISKLEPYFTIGINRAFLRIETTLLMWQDMSLWFQERKKVSKLKSVLLARDRADPENHAFHFRLAGREYKLVNDPTTLYGRGSSGALAFQLAYSFGCNPVILLGMDCKYSGNKTNFYGKNSGHNHSTLPNCVKGLKWIKDCQDKTKIINCSDNDIFKEHHKLDDVLEQIKYLGSWSQVELKKMLLYG